MNFRSFPFRLGRRAAHHLSDGVAPRAAERLDRCEKRLAEADPWAFDRLMSELIVGAAYPSDSPRRTLLLGFLSALPQAIVRDRCPCGDAGCHTYAFIGRHSAGDDVQSLHLPCPPRWEAFNVEYTADGTLVGVEIFLE